MQNYLTGYSVSAHATAFAGQMPLQEESLLPRVLFQSARNLGTSAKAMVSRVRATNPLKATSGQSQKENNDATQVSQNSSEAEFREDLRHFLDPKPNGQRTERNN